MAEQYDRLTEEEISSIRDSLIAWARKSPERVALLLLDGSEVTTLDIARAMEEREGRVYAHVMNLFAVGYQDESLESILADFDRDEIAGPGQLR